MFRPHNRGSNHHALGTAGLFLMLVTARLAGTGYSDPRGPVGRGVAFAARRGIDVIGAIGWMVDHLSVPGQSAARIRATVGPPRPTMAGPSVGPEFS